ncbi:MAG: hypothetical protein HZB26_25815 [Candidatus Hydrogenedentes bacterium]|nr:hypothetical protein [Candidatus Hydrogenedentota bacterium]
MNVNPLIAPTLLLAYALAFASYAVTRRIKGVSLQAAWFVAAVLGALPAVSMPLYYTHLYDHWAAYYAFRALPYSELTASGAGLLAGVVAHWARRFHARGRFVDMALLVLLTLGVAAPYAKPVLAPVAPGVFQDRWSEGVCLQSTASCGAACTATFLKLFGFDMTERQIAQECFTYVAGTENWYLARALRKRGLNVTFVVLDPKARELPIPCIAGIKMGEAGHFICILGEENGAIVVGDPLMGRYTCTKDELFAKIRFAGFFMHIETQSASRRMTATQ